MPRYKRTYSGAFRCQVIVTGIVVVLASLYQAFSSSYVQQNQVYTQDVAHGSSFTALSAGDVPFYNAGGYPVIDGATTQIYHFQWFVYATDSLRPAVLVYALFALTLAVVIPLDKVNVLLYQVIVIVFLLLELVKLVYFILIIINIFGLSCVNHAFCRNRNPAYTATPDTSFVIVLISSAVFVVVYIVLSALPRAIRSERLSSNPVLLESEKSSPAVSEVDSSEISQSYQTGTSNLRPRSFVFRDLSGV